MKRQNRFYDEQTYLKNVKTVKSSLKSPYDKYLKQIDDLVDNKIPAYKWMTKERAEKTYRGEGGFLPILMGVARVLGPLLASEVIPKVWTKLTGSGKHQVDIVHRDGTELNEDEKREVICNCLMKHPHIGPILFN